jgi:ABC-type transport system involved in cytochrome bd biosynthesis fused ATPase/permease subunit
MLLDEATSALDNQTEARVIDNLEKLRCTRITVAHRLSTIRNADLIVVMDKGRVVETGTYTELAARGGLFAQLLAASQSSPSHVEIPYEAAFAGHASRPASTGRSSLQRPRAGAERA